MYIYMYIYIYIYIILAKKFFTSSEQRNSNKSFRKNMSCDNIKSHKTTGP